MGNKHKHTKPAQWVSSSSAAEANARVHWTLSNRRVKGKQTWVTNEAVHPDFKTAVQPTLKNTDVSSSEGSLSTVFWHDLCGVISRLHIAVTTSKFYCNSLLWPNTPTANNIPIRPSFSLSLISIQLDHYSDAKWNEISIPADVLKESWECKHADSSISLKATLTLTQGDPQHLLYLNCRLLFPYCPFSAVSTINQIKFTCFLGWHLRDWDKTARWGITKRRDKGDHFL